MSLTSFKWSVYLAAGIVGGMFIHAPAIAEAPAFGEVYRPLLPVTGNKWNRTQLAEQNRQAAMNNRVLVQNNKALKDQILQRQKLSGIADTSTFADANTLPDNVAYNQMKDYANNQFEAQKQFAAQAGNWQAHRELEKRQSAFNKIIPRQYGQTAGGAPVPTKDTTDPTQPQWDTSYQQPTMPVSATANPASNQLNWFTDNAVTSPDAFVTPEQMIGINNAARENAMLPTDLQKADTAHTNSINDAEYNRLWREEMLLDSDPSTSESSDDN